MDVLAQSSAYIWERWGFPCSLSLSLCRSLSPPFSRSLPLLLFPHAASQTALITVPFEAVFQMKTRRKQKSS